MRSLNNRSILRFLFESELIGVTAFSLSTVGGFKWESGITFSADFLVTVEFFSDSGNGWIHDTTSKSQD